ncbi:hypothetical protein [Methanosarcina sp. KYL-1]|uniref:hypothetical protein n=1 Tax=Methanosarcina sp. KYL-1 TaxID=2602068 RepID=UPI002101497D|nr:hypothetical protein [Methanosarcina sp. KYL-1]
MSDRDAVIEELKVQGKWQGGDEPDDDGTAGEPEEGGEDMGSDTESESAPFVGLVWGIATVAGAVFVLGRRE